MAPPHYKLVYFTSRGKGEAIRHLLILADQPFEDFRFTDEEWHLHKPNSPLGQSPTLEIDGKTTIGQTTAILRYLAEQHGFVGKTPLEKAQIDMYGQYMQDMWEQPGMATISVALMGKHKEAKYNGKEGVKLFFDTFIRPEVAQFAPRFEKALAANPNGFLVGDQLSWADLFTAEQFARLRDFGNADIVVPYPHIRSLIARIHSDPRIARWIKERPASLR